jgi:hypothetical protein
MLAEDPPGTAAAMVRIRPVLASKRQHLVLVTSLIDQAVELPDQLTRRGTARYASRSGWPTAPTDADHDTRAVTRSGPGQLQGRGRAVPPDWVSPVPTVFSLPGACAWAVGRADREKTPGRTGGAWRCVA